ncbi:MAG: type II secretion system protein [Elusimicrobia bacterium]|nr:type II secretion system protein [Elusimicrobiota bacterium]
MNNQKGFTLIELLVVVLIIGILAAVGVPSYLKSVETTKADDAVAMVNMIGTTNKMFALDHNNSYVVGTFPVAANTGCGAGACPAAGPYTTACFLVFCKYLADQNFGSKPYTLNACDPGGAACGSSGVQATADAKRKAGAYAAWGYYQTSQGVITGYGAGVPAPTY